MTVSSTTVKNSYSGNGSTTQFAYGFKIFADSDLIVIIRSAAGTETVKTLTTHYTVAGAGDASGGSITFTSGNTPASGETVVIIREVPQTQAIDYIANDPFPAESHEEGLDRATMTTQQVQEEVDRSIKLSRTNTMTSTEFTVGATERANKILAFDSAGEISVTQELGTYKGTDATVTTEAYNVRDIIKSTTSAQLNNVYICIADAVVGDSLTDTDHFELLVDAVSAATSATAAASSATAAATSATASATSATASANSATAAASSESTASTKASEASTSASNASTSETNAASSATSAASSATTATTKASEASTSATNAASSATAAASSATTATTKASEAATSATNAASSATTATTKASEAATSATNSASSATASANSATAAATSATEAAASADAFDDIYLGSKSSDPSTDNDGDALAAGMLYFNTTNDILRVYSGSAWQDAAISSTGVVTLTDTQTLTNKTLTAPKINEDVAVTSTATELNLLDGVSGLVQADFTKLAAVTSDATELNILDGATVVVGEVNALDLGGTGTGTAIASKAVVLDGNKDYTGIRNVSLTGTLGVAGISSFAVAANVAQSSLTSSSNAVAWDASAKPNAVHVTTENTTFSAPTNNVEGAFIALEINYNGSHTIAFNTVFEFAGSTAPTFTSTDGKTDILVFRYNGAVWQEVGRTLNLSES